MRRIFAITANLFLLLGFLTNATASAEEDAALLDAADAEVPAYFETLQKIVEIESGSADRKGLLAVADVLDHHLTSLGFSTQRHPSTTGAKADSVIGVKNGNGKKRLLLMAHMDTVYETGILQTNSYRTDGDKVFGPGVADAKGGIAMILHSLQILYNSGWDDFATITVLFNPDEEVGSPGSHKLITELASQADFVLSFEPAWSGAPVPYYLVLGHSAYAQVTLEIKGVAAHASNPALGKNAVLELAHQLVQTRDFDKAVDGAQLTWTNVKADQAFNQVPGVAVAIGDGRITKPGADEKLLQALRERVDSDKLIPGTEAAVRLEILRPMLHPTAGSDKVVRIANKIHAEIGLDTFYPLKMLNASTDAGYASLSGDAVVTEGLGPNGDGYHGTAEHILIDSVRPRLYLICRLLMELGN
jgi:glutamate carboxypeptidase